MLYAVCARMLDFSPTFIVECRCRCDSLSPIIIVEFIPILDYDWICVWTLRVIRRISDPARFASIETFEEGLLILCWIEWDVTKIMEMVQQNHDCICCQIHALQLSHTNNTNKGARCCWHVNIWPEYFHSIPSGKQQNNTHTHTLVLNWAMRSIIMSSFVY